MQLTIKEFFDKFPMLMQANVARKIGVRKEVLTFAKQGASLSKKELDGLNKIVKQLAQDLAKVKLTHEHIHNGPRRIKTWK